jgi:hypothetical protein
MRFKDREERERYMDSLERQMEHQREQIRRTLDRIEEGSGRRRTALKSKLRSSLPSFPGRKSVRDAGEEVSQAATERPDSQAPRSWWEFWR